MKTDKQIADEATQIQNLAIEMNEVAKETIVAMAELDETAGGHIKIAAVMTASAGIFADAIRAVNESGKASQVQLMSMLLHRIIQPELDKLMAHAKRLADEEGGADG